MIKYTDEPLHQTEGVLYFRYHDLITIPELEVVIMGKVNRVVDVYSYLVDEVLEEWVIDKKTDRFLGWFYLGEIRLPLDHNNQDVLELLKQRGIEHFISFE